MAINDTTFQLSGAWLEVLSSATNSEGLLNYRDFSQLALFHPQLGYYSRADHARVGKDGTTDFYTSSSHSDVFPHLIVEASRTLCAKNDVPVAGTTFYEVGAEPTVDHWSAVEMPFHDYQILRLNDPLEFATSSVVYSNELFDAQPFYRWISQAGRWFPIHLSIQGEEITEVIGNAALSEQESRAATQLPPAPSFEYHLDLSIAATRLLERLLNPKWKGVFVAIDYGMMWKQLSEETPQGTARAYFKHQQTACLFNHPGEQDLTTHVCWDHFIERLEKAGFESIQLRSQSRFLMEESSRAIEPIVTASTSLVDKRKSQLLELLSPGFFGQKFQVLSAVKK